MQRTPGPRIEPIMEASSLLLGSEFSCRFLLRHSSLPTWLLHNTLIRLGIALTLLTFAPYLGSFWGCPS